MPVTGNVAWDQRLESYKGRDTAQYVAVAAELAKTCPACRAPLAADDQVSLLVDITQSTAPDGTECLSFTDAVCHRRCSAPALAVRQVPWQPDTLSPVAARVVLSQKSAFGRARVFPVLAFTLEPVLAFRENGGELTSALVSLLLSRGFQLAMSPEYPAILEQALPAGPDCRFTLSDRSLLLFTIKEEIMYREQLHPRNVDDAEWLRTAAQTGNILLISGDHLDITDTDLDIAAAGKRGTLVIGLVPITGTGLSAIPTQPSTWEKGQPAGFRTE